MSAKKWTIIFLSAVLLTLIVIVGTNLVVDPFGYFRGLSGDAKSYTLDDTYYMREFKANHLKNFGDQYDAFLIGGSKAGAVNTDKLKEVDGYNYYNCWVLSGSFLDYLEYTRYVAENCHPKKIMIFVSPTQMKGYDRQKSLGDIYYIPAEITGGSKITEFTKFCFKNLSASVDEIKKDKEITYPLYPTGERNLGKYYKASKNPNFMKTYVLDKENYGMGLRFLKTGKFPSKYATVNQQNIQALKEIKSICDQKGIKLQVIMGAAFLGEQISYEGEIFYDFLRETAAITDDFWCFDDFSDVNMNPYNFYNNTHFWYEIADLMFDTIKTGEQQYEGFGTKITLDNVNSYIQERKVKYAEILAYYKANNTFPFLSADHKSNIKAAEKANYKGLK